MKNQDEITRKTMESVTRLYTAEIGLRHVPGGLTRRGEDPETGTGFWHMDLCLQEEAK